MKNKTGLILAILLPLQFVAIKIASGYPTFIENWYSNGVYPYISSVMRFSLGFLPFSLGDLLYCFLIFSLLRWLYFRIKYRLRNVNIWIIDSLAFLSIIYACFHIFWGLNYYRLPLHKTLKIKNTYTTEELVLLTETLIKKSNEIHSNLVENDSLKVPYDFTKNELLKKTVEGYDYLSKDYPKLTYNGNSLKRSLFSIPLTYMGFNGYLNPLTNEAQVNTQILAYKIPTTASHEIGHQLGFAKENEANFIACLATMKNPDPYFRYSGFTFALRYCLNELYLRDQCKADELIKKIHPGILENFKEVRIFWEEHQNPLEPFFQFTYNGFLKANNQQEGMKSYSYVVALLVNYFDDVENAF
ncbi:DUF3810 domain-containing protein [Gillisia sp. M10.2A]|uniref:DUF3810 domain-containing protein n=1 Tax=Gillisia lutea TaxID=2909668 RepID=A0ABS9EIQ7_9FLAO|nr:DUF3810 domain-containing protein [Gillisia lutea]MCF4101358.1 DUF3810 domain-containing protein [Gillisia lutea]